MFAALICVVSLMGQAPSQPVYYYPVPAQQAPVIYYYQTQPVPQPVPTGQQVPAQVAPTNGDPYGFLSWLNATRAGYGLSPVGYDSNLEAWAAQNSAQQAASGLGHFVMGPARRQNSAMGWFPGIESMWMASPAHRAALLDPTIRWIGIAQYGSYWTLNAF